MIFMEVRQADYEFLMKKHHLSPDFRQKLSSDQSTYRNDYHLCRVCNLQIPEVLVKDKVFSFTEHSFFPRRPIPLFVISRSSEKISVMRFEQEVGSFAAYSVKVFVRS